MENASKALTMAGGILIAILVIGALLLMFNQIGNYERAQTTDKKTSQLAQFNMDFERYTYDNGITGTDLISLANKIIDYNKKDGVANSVNYNIKMSLTIINMNNFKKKYGYSNDNEALFKANEYVISQDNENKNALKIVLDSYNGQDIELLKKISSIYDKYKNDGDVEDKIREALIQIDSKYKGWNSNKSPTLLQIKNYKEYSEFKTSKFKSYKNPDYEDGQITNLYFEFYK